MSVPSLSSDRMLVENKNSPKSCSVRTNGAKRDGIVRNGFQYSVRLNFHGKLSSENKYDHYGNLVPNFTTNNIVVVVARRFLG